jgi:hypothetical protein
VLIYNTAADFGNGPRQKPLPGFNYIFSVSTLAEWMLKARQQRWPSIQDFASAIFGFEGGDAGDRNVRNNNPGNLKFAGQPGATLGDDGFAVFPSLDSGFAALDRQLTKTTNEMPTLTLTQFFARYLGQSDFLTPKVTSQGDPFSYANTVAGKLGVSADQTLGQIFGGG